MVTAMNTTAVQLWNSYLFLLVQKQFYHTHHITVIQFNSATHARRVPTSHHWRPSHLGYFLLPVTYDVDMAVVSTSGDGNNTVVDPGFRRYHSYYMYRDRTLLRPKRARARARTHTHTHTRHSQVTCTASLHAQTLNN